MKKLAFFIAAIVCTSVSKAQSNIYEIVPKPIFTGDSAKAIQLAASTNNFDSSVSIAMIIFIDNKTDTPDRLQKRYRFPAKAFAHFPASKTEILAKLEEELQIKILTR